MPPFYFQIVSIGVFQSKDRALIVNYSQKAFVSGKCYLQFALQ